jgi:calcium-activated chloride channel regulator 4
MPLNVTRSKLSMINHPFIQPRAVALAIAGLSTLAGTGTASAAICNSPSVDQALAIELPCILYNDQTFKARLLSAPTPSLPLAWRLDTASLAAASCEPESSRCTLVGTDLSLELHDLQIGGSPFTARLAFAPRSTDPASLYWSYVSHQAEEGATDPDGGNTTVDGTSGSGAADGTDTDTGTGTGTGTGANAGTDTGTGTDSAVTGGTGDGSGTTTLPAITPRDFELRVSYYDNHANTLAKQEAITANLRHMAEGVFEATNGAHRIGKVTVFSGGGFADNTDILWVKDQGDDGRPCWFNAHVGGRGTPGTRVQHCDIGGGDPETYNMLEKRRDGGYTLTHEWGHFFYGLFDEYVGYSECSGDDPGSPCTGDIGVEPSLMNSTWVAIDQETGGLADARVLNFSTADLNKAATNAQYRVYGASAWETLMRAPASDPQSASSMLQRPYYPELAAAAPAAGQLPSVEINTAEGVARATEALKVIFKQGGAESGQRRDGAEEGDGWVGTVRLALIETSGRITAAQLDELKAALQQTIDAAEVGDWFGVATFAAESETLLQLSRISGEEDRDRMIAAVEGVTVGSGEPDLAAALLAASSLMEESEAPEDAFWSVYLYASGNHSGSADPIDSASLLDESDIALYAIAPTADAAGARLLKGVSERSGGFYRKAATGRALQRVLEEIVADSSPVVDVTVAMREIVPAEKPVSTFYLDQTLSEVELELEFPGSLDATTLVLVDPNGEEQTISSDWCNDVADEAEEGEDAINFCLYEIDQPASGNWQLRAESVEAEWLFMVVNAIPNDGEYDIAASIDRMGDDPVVVGQPVTIQARVAGDMPVTAIQVEGWYEQPDGEWVSFTLTDDGAGADASANDGTYSAMVTPTMVGEYYIEAHFDNAEMTAQFTDYGVSYAPDRSGKVPERQLVKVPFGFQRVAIGQFEVE